MSAALRSAADVISAIALITGCVLTLAAAIGVLRLPDVLSRMHSGTKPQTLGLLLVLLGAAIRLRDSVDAWMFVLIGAFQLVTAPVAAHLVGRLAYRNGNLRRDLLIVDEMAEPDRPDGADRPDEAGQAGGVSSTAEGPR